MKQWARARHVMQCGFCGEPIRKNEPVLFIVTIGKKFKRCVDCTNDPVPDVLPDAPIEDDTTSKQITPSGQRSFLPIGTLAKDFKLAQSKAGDE